MILPILRPVHRWYCPNCKATDVTHEARPHSRMHTCPKLGMLSLPMDLLMVPEGTRAKVETNEREDYVGQENVFLSPTGRPVMNVVITRDEGQDCAVFAPSVSMSVRGD
jgi:hypothetical protein